MWLGSLKVWICSPMFFRPVHSETRPSTVPGTWQDVQSKRTRKEEEKKRKSTLKSSSRPPRDKDGQRPSRDGQQKRDKDGSLKSSSVVADGTTTSLPSPPPVATRPSTTGATPRVPRKRTVVVVRSNGAAVPTAATPAPAPAKPSPPPKPAVIAHGAWANGVIFHKPTQPEAAPVIDLTGLVLKTAAAVAAGQPSATPAVAPAAAAANPGVVVVKTSLQPRPTQPNGQVKCLFVSVKSAFVRPRNRSVVVCCFLVLVSFYRRIIYHFHLSQMSLTRCIVRLRLFLGGKCNSSSSSKLNSKRLHNNSPHSHNQRPLPLRTCRACSSRC